MCWGDLSVNKILTELTFLGRNTTIDMMRKSSACCVRTSTGCSRDKAPSLPSAREPCHQAWSLPLPSQLPSSEACSSHLPRLRFLTLIWQQASIEGSPSLPWGGKPTCIAPAASQRSPLESAALPLADSCWGVMSPACCPLAHCVLLLSSPPFYPAAGLSALVNRSVPKPPHPVGSHRCNKFLGFSIYASLLHTSLSLSRRHGPALARTGARWQKTCLCVSAPLSLTAPSPCHMEV